MHNSSRLPSSLNSTGRDFSGPDRNSVRIGYKATRRSLRISQPLGLGGFEQFISPKSSELLKSPKAQLSHARSCRSSREEQRKVLTPKQAVDLYGNKLTPHELKEIHAFESIYFLGLGAEKDSEFSKDGKYNVVKHDHMAYRYELYDALGEGSFGQVYSAFDHKEQRKVAVKIIKNSSKYYECVLREIEILKGMSRVYSQCNHCVELLNHFTFRKHKVLVFCYYPKTLRRLLRTQAALPLPQVYSLLHQLVRGVYQLHAKQIIHCDLKPENLMFEDEACTRLRVIDLGSACSEKDKLYKYVQSRYYRAPEVILGYAYTRAIDMWSVGCIAAELVTGQPLFQGTNEWHQLNCFRESLDDPPVRLLEHAPRKTEYLANAAAVTPGSKSLQDQVPNTDLLDFITRCLEWDPASRLTAREALNLRMFRPTKSKPARKSASLTGPKRKPYDD